MKECAIANVLLSFVYVIRAQIWFEYEEWPSVTITYRSANPLFNSNHRQIGINYSNIRMSSTASSIARIIFSFVSMYDAGVAFFLFVSSAIFSLSRQHQQQQGQVRRCTARRIDRSWNREMERSELTDWAEKKSIEIGSRCYKLQNEYCTFERRPRRIGKSLTMNC